MLIFSMLKLLLQTLHFNSNQTEPETRHKRTWHLLIAPTETIFSLSKVLQRLPWALYTPVVHIGALDIISLTTELCKKILSSHRFGQILTVV